MNNSMINPSVVDLLKKVEDRYSLVIVTSRRARQCFNCEAEKECYWSKEKKNFTIKY